MRWRGQSKPMTGRASRSALANLLAGCTDAKLAEFVEHGLPTAYANLPGASDMLARAKRERGL